MNGGGGGGFYVLDEVSVGRKGCVELRCGCVIGCKEGWLQLDWSNGQG